MDHKIFRIALTAAFGAGLALLVTANACAAPWILTKEERLEDFRYLHQVLSDNYPFFDVKERLIGRNWHDQEAEFEAAFANAASPREFYEAASDMVEALENSHSHMLGPDDVVSRAGPLQADRYAGHLFTDAVIAANEQWNNVLGLDDLWPSYSARYVQGSYWTTYVDRDLREQLPVGTRITHVNDQEVLDYVKTRSRRPHLLMDPVRNQLYRRHMPTPPGHTVHLRGQHQGEPVEAEIPITVPAREAPDERPNTTTAVLEPDTIAYIRVRSFARRHMQEDGPQLQAFLEEVSHFPYIFIDIRGNGGGETSYWRRYLVGPTISEPHVAEHNIAWRDSPEAQDYMRSILGPGYDLLPVGRQLDERWGDGAPELWTEDFSEMRLFPHPVLPRRSVGFEGSIVLLVDDRVYSASENLARFAKETGWATLVGTATAGDGITVYPAYFVLPNSQLVARIPLVLGFDGLGRVNEAQRTQPDVYAEYVPEDFWQGRDPTQPGRRDNMLQHTLDLVHSGDLPEPKSATPGLWDWFARSGHQSRQKDAYGLPRILSDGTQLTGEGPWAVREIRVAGAEKTDTENMAALAEAFLGGDVSLDDIVRLERQLSLYQSHWHASVSLHPVAPGRVDVVISVLEGHPLLLSPFETMSELALDLAARRVSLHYANIGGHLINVGGQRSFGHRRHFEAYLDFPTASTAAGRLSMGYDDSPPTADQGRLHYLTLRQRHMISAAWQGQLQQHAVQYDGDDGPQQALGLDLSLMRWESVDGGEGMHADGDLAIGARFLPNKGQWYPWWTAEARLQAPLSARATLEITAASGAAAANTPAFLPFQRRPLLFAAEDEFTFRYQQGDVEVRREVGRSLSVSLHGQWARTDTFSQGTWAAGASAAWTTPIGLELRLRQGWQLDGERSTAALELRTSF